MKLCLGNGEKVGRHTQKGGKAVYGYLEVVNPILEASPGNGLSYHSVVCPSFRPRRGGRVVECGGLENRYTSNGIESSNLSLSALFPPAYLFLNDHEFSLGRRHLVPVRIFSGDMIEIHSAWKF